MIKSILIFALLAVAAPAMSKVLMTKDNLLSVTISGDQAFVRTPAEDDVLSCYLSKTISSPQWESGVPGQAIFYKCTNGAVLSFKSYTSPAHDDMLFIFEGDKLMYSEKLNGKLH